MMNKIWVSAFVVVGVFIAIALFVSFYLPNVKESIPGREEIKLSPGDTIGQGLELYYPFDNIANSVTPDMSSSRRNGMITNGDLANSILGSVMQFPASGTSGINVSGQDIDFGSAFSISTWVKLDVNVSESGQIFEVIFGDKDSATSIPSVSLILNDNNKIVFNNVFNFSNTASVVSSSSLNKEIWYHIAVELENNSLKIYIDGILDKSVSASGVVSHNGNQQFFVGSLYGESAFLRGALNDFRAYNRALTIEEIKYLANKTNIANPAGSNSPIVDLISPSDNSLVNTLSNRFIANLTDDVLLDKASFYLWNSTSTVNQNTFSTPGYSYLVNLSYTLPRAGDYKWGIVAEDSNGQNSSVNASFSYDLTLPLISISNPLNRSYNDSINSLQFSASDAHLDSCWYSFNNGVTNNSATCNQQVNVFATNGNYNWAVYANDSVGNVNFSKVAFSVTDDTPPVIDFDVPTNRTYLSSTLLFKIILNEKGDAWFSLDGGDSRDMNTSDNRTFTYRVSDLSRGSHVAAFTAEDLQGNSVDVNVVFSVNINTGTSGTGTSGTGTTGTTGTETTGTEGTTGTSEGTTGGTGEQQIIDGTGADAQSNEVDSLFWIIVGLVLLSAAIVVTIVIILIVHKNRQQVQQTQQQGPQYRQGGVVVSGNTGNNFR